MEATRVPESLKVRVNRRLNPGDNDSRTVDSFIIILIALNVLAVIIETEPNIAERYARAFFIFEIFSSIFFTIEYVARIWTADLDPRYSDPIKGRIRYTLSFMAMVDLIAILPFYLQAIEMDLRIARAIRLMRLVRILKMGRYAHAVRTLSNVFVRKKEELAMATFATIMLLVLSSAAMYFVEGGPGVEGFSSIPDAMWWAIVTLTSVGYGDVIPSTGGGQFVGAVICVIGVLLVALPAGILAAGFNEEIREQRRGRDSDTFGFCPHCGKQLIPGEELE